MSRGMSETKQKSSGVNSEVSTQSVTTQIKPTFSRHDLGAELKGIITDNAFNLHLYSKNYYTFCGISFSVSTYFTA